MRAAMATFALVVIAFSPVSGMAAASTEDKTDYLVPVNAILPILAPGSNPDINDDPDVKVGNAVIVDSLPMGGHVLVLVECVSAPEFVCSGEILTET